MATENLDGIYSAPAAADLRTRQYHWGAINTSRQVALCAAGALPDGLIHNLPNTGEMARLVQKKGVVVKVKLGGTVTVGAKMYSGANGTAVTVATAGHICIGKFLQAGVIGDIVEATYDGFCGANP